MDRTRRDSRRAAAFALACATMGVMAAPAICHCTGLHHPTDTMVFSIMGGNSAGPMTFEDFATISTFSGLGRATFRANLPGPGR